MIVKEYKKALCIIQLYGFFSLNTIRRWVCKNNRNQNNNQTKPSRNMVKMPQPMNISTNWPILAY